MSAQVSSQVRVTPILAWVAVAPFVLWALARVIGLDGFTPASQLMAFTPYVVAASVIPLALTLLTRQWWVAGVAALACAALGLCVLPRAFGSASTMDGVPVTVMSVNMLEGGADAEAIVKVVREQHVDVLTVQEFTPSARQRLTAAGLTTLLPYDGSHPVGETRGSGLYSRYPLTGIGADLNAGGFYQARGIVQVPGAPPVAVESVHPLAPAEPAFVPLWKQDLRDQKPAQTAGTPQILAGDFNSTLDHSELGRLIATGYRDAAASVGKGLTPTWPYYGSQSLVTPKITLDHVLVDSRIGVEDFNAFTIPESDHRAIVTRLTLPTA
jgi:endonuclease/exonuclease/phosphatase family metal-dependent hydrolase